MPKQIAQWNPARDVWEEATTGLFCEHSDVYSATWPSSGMTRGGTAYELPTSAHPTAGSASSCSLPTPRATRGGSATETVNLLPTPVADHSRGLAQPGTDYASLPNVALSLMPTPRATDETKGGPNQRGSSGDLMLPSAVMLLPTPTVNDMGEGKTVEHWDEWTATMQARHGNGNGHGKSLAIEAQRLLPTLTAMDSQASGGSSPSNVTLTDAVVRTSFGAHMNPRFAVGNAPSDDPHPYLPSADPREPRD